MRHKSLLAGVASTLPLVSAPSALADPPPTPDAPEVSPPTPAPDKPVYLRYWPNVATALADNTIALAGTDGTVTHSAHDFNFFGNVSVGYAFDL